MSPGRCHACLPKRLSVARVLVEGGDFSQPSHMTHTPSTRKTSTSQSSRIPAPAITAHAATAGPGHRVWAWPAALSCALWSHRGGHLLGRPVPEPPTSQDSLPLKPPPHAGPTATPRACGVRLHGCLHLPLAAPRPAPPLPSPPLGTSLTPFPSVRGPGLSGTHRTSRTHPLAELCSCCAVGGRMWGGLGSRPPPPRREQ